jgi:hypothetical protein
MTPCQLFDKNREGYFLRKNSTYSPNITPIKKIQIQMAYDIDMQSSPVINMALRDDPMIWLTPLSRPPPLPYAQNGCNSLRQACHHEKKFLFGGGRNAQLNCCLLNSRDLHSKKGNWILIRIRTKKYTSQIHIKIHMEMY